MAKSNSTASITGKNEVRTLIPRFVRELNRVAEQQGLGVSIRIGPVPDWWPVSEYAWAKGDVVLSNWAGTKAQFAATGLVPLGYRTPSSRGWFCVPHHGARQVAKCRPHLCGFIAVTGNTVEVELYGGPKPERITTIGAVEICESDNFIVVHGAAEALIAGRFCDATQMPGKRSTQCAPNREYFYDLQPAWFTRRFPDGSIVHWRDNDKGKDRRAAAVAEKARLAREYRVRKEQSSELATPTEPQSAESFRDLCGGLMENMLSFLARRAGWDAKNAPFRYDDEALDAIRASMMEIMDRVREGRIIKLRDPFDADRMAAARAAESDSRFQGFMARLTNDKT